MWLDIAFCVFHKRKKDFKVQEKWKLYFYQKRYKLFLKKINLISWILKKLLIIKFFIYKYANIFIFNVVDWKKNVVHIN